eukprot:4794415-Pleurochrysis_carterae.AAC.1
MLAAQHVTTSLPTLPYHCQPGVEGLNGLVHQHWPPRALVTLGAAPLSAVGRCARRRQSWRASASGSTAEGAGWSLARRSTTRSATSSASSTSCARSPRARLQKHDFQRSAGLFRRLLNRSLLRARRRHPLLDAKHHLEFARLTHVRSVDCVLLLLLNFGRP